MARTRGISFVVVFSVFLTLMGPTKPAAAAGPEVDYIYDELSRLRAVVDAASDAAIYSYDAAGNITSIDRHAASTVDVVEFTPNAGAVGDEIKIYGTGFDPAPANNSVTFNGTSATVSAATPTELVVEVPVGATTGAIAVSAPAGSSTSASDFVVESGASPSISSVSAFIGVAGDSITIDGAGFETDPELNRVRFGYTHARVTAATGSQLIVNVPPAQASGKISVRTPAGKATAGDFFVPPTPFTPADLDETQRLPYEVTTTATVSTAEKVAQLIFDGRRGQRILLWMTNLTTSSCPAATIYDPRDDQVATSGCVKSSSGNLLEVAALPLTGTYSVVFDPISTSTGSLDFTLYDVPPDLEDTITIGGPEQTYGPNQEGQNFNVRFDATAGDRVLLHVVENAYPSCLRVFLYDPDDVSIWNTCAKLSGSFMDSMVLSKTGEYRIFVDPWDIQTGTFTLRLYDVPQDLEDTITIDGPAVEIETAVGQDANLSFSGTSGASVRLSMTASSYTGCPWVTVFEPDDSLLAQDNCMNAGEQFDMTLPDTGTYRIFVNPPGISLGGATFTLASIAGTAVTSSSSATAQDEGPSSEQDISPSNFDDGQVPPSEPTASLAGQVRDLRGAPLRGVTLRVEDQSVRTDAKGEFLLTGLPGGHAELVIDGRSANAGRRTYGVYETGVYLKAGQTKHLPYTIFMTELDTDNTVQLPSPTTEEIVLTTPHMPGLEVRIPAGTVITGMDGEVVTEVNLSIIPVDKPPFPLPKGTSFPMYFTLQPGGASLSKGARVIYPNLTGAPVGERVDFWNYDAAEYGWYIYGRGTVSADGSKVEPDEGVEIYEFSGSGFNRLGALLAALFGPIVDLLFGGDGDPVDLGTGLFVLDKTDLVLDDVLPISLTRTYRPEDSRSRSVGVGSMHQYDIFLQDPTPATPYENAELILPDSGRIRFVRTSPGTLLQTAVFEAQETPTAFFKSVLSWNGDGWDLKLQDGTEMTFGRAVDGTTASQLIAIHDRTGNSVSIHRENGQTGNVSSVRSPNGRWMRFTYDASDRITQVTDSIGRSVDYTYDASGRLETVTDPEGGVTEYTYDASHRLLTAEDARGIVFLTNEYFANGRVKRQTLADGGTFNFAYTDDANGNIIQTEVTDPRGNVRRVDFTDGYITSDTRAVGTPEEQRLTYDRDPTTHRITSVTDPLGRITVYTYDDLGNVTQVTQLDGTPDARTIGYAYEPEFNQLASVTDPLGKTTTMSYDARGRLVEVADPLGHATTLGYDDAPEPTSVTDALGKTTTLSYDLGDLISTEDPLGNITSTFTDSGGRVRFQTDPVGARTRYDYDELNQIELVTDALGGQTALAYDANGNLTSLTDPRNNATSYTYDDMDRVATRTDPLGKTTTYSYDLNGNPAEITDRTGQVTEFGYDPLDRLVFAGFDRTGSGASTSYESTFEHTYDAGDRLTEAADSAAGIITLGYDDFDRLTSEQSPQGTVAYTYDAADRRTSMTAGAAEPVTYTFDDADRLTGVSRPAQAATISYDDADRRTSLGLPGGITQTYAYDDAGRLTGIDIASPGTAAGDLGYATDAAGRRAKLTGSLARTGLPAAVGSATYDAANRLSTWGGATLTYDDEGRLLSDGAATYAWNARGELTNVSGAASASFGYDAFGRRASRTSGGLATAFLYDGATPVAELTAGVATATMLTGLGPDEYYTRTEILPEPLGTTTRRVLLTDALGSVIALADAAGDAATSYTYAPYGQTTTTGASSANRHRFTGREAEEDGLYYYRARYYSATHGRFISQDPIGYAGGDANLYGYVGASPTNHTDPHGLIVAAAVGGAVFGGLGYIAGAAFGGRKFSVGGFVRAIIGGAIAGVLSYGIFRAASGALRWAAAKAPGAAPNRIYSARALIRSAEEAGPFHNFPASFDDVIFQRGSRALIKGAFQKSKPFLSNDVVQYRISGVINRSRGVFEVFTRPSISGRSEVIIHRFFRPLT